MQNSDIIISYSMYTEKFGDRKYGSQHYQFCRPGNDEIEVACETNEAEAKETCLNDCEYASDDICDDGGLG